MGKEECRAAAQGSVGLVSAAVVGRWFCGLLTGRPVTGKALHWDEERNTSGSTTRRLPL